MKVLLIVIDAASPRVLCPAVQTRRLRHLARIVDAGAMHQASVTIFPSITPAATSSIVTGTYPATHGIAGAAWYDEARKEIAYYGDDFWTIAKEGFGAFVRDFLVRLNGDRLRAPTLFEIVERQGLKATCINYLVYKGLVAHDVTLPRALTLFPGVPRTETVLGPSALCLGDFVTPCSRDGRKVEDRGGVMHRFGMDDASTAVMLATLAERGELGDFTLAYFADNDFRSHEVGPAAALPVLDEVDKAIGDLFDAAGGAERFLAETCVIVTSDHGHSDILDDAETAVIRLDKVFESFRQADLPHGWRDHDEILLCPNMRAAQIYLHRPSAVTIDRLTRTALTDDRIDLVLWHTRVGSAGHPDRYMACGHAGRLEFWRTDSESYDAADAYGTRWCWRGEPAVLALDVEDRAVTSEVYPNAFERIAGVLDAPNSGEVWLTARPGCEFELPGGKAHVGGGSHGALHALDSLSPLIIGGAGPPAIPLHPRAIDIAPLCLDLLGLQRPETLARR
jgi:hypothetical protein